MSVTSGSFLVHLTLEMIVSVTVSGADCSVIGDASWELHASL
ncbi:hypothetical protein [Halocatena salina]|nr:hypothetical protein [Halocatena salina]